MTVEFCYLIFITADYYAINNFIIPRYFQKKKFGYFFMATAAVISFSAWVRALIALQMSRYYFSPFTNPDFNRLYINSVINISLWVLLITLFKVLTDRIQTQRMMEILEKERVKSELDYLKAQINPHALFNSLNTIYGHIDKNNLVARGTLLQFSELLRYQLYECGAEKVALTRELEYIRSYIAFQRLRKDERLIVNCEIEEADSPYKIAPLLLIVLIENAFKFVSNFYDRENKICIKIFIKGHILNTSIMNTRDGSVISAKPSCGIGISNLKRRLELLYNNKYELTTNVRDTFYETHLNIDLT